MDTLLSSVVILAVSCGLGAAMENQVSEGFDINETVNDTATVMSNGSESVISNQYIVMLQNNTTHGEMQVLVNEIEGMGAQITGVYSELFNGFAFKTQDNQSAEEIVRFLEASPLVQSVTSDREVSIQTQ